jgi:DNA-binding Lrp family transcriptional regulator
MSAVPDNIVPFALPKKPRIKEKDAPPDQRKVAVLPIRAISDRTLTDGMFRTLAILCSYCNRAGLTWVGQAKLAKDMGVSQQAIGKQLLKLQKTGYVQIISKGFRGVRGNTLRVVFDPTISAEDAIAMTSNKEDTRPPAIREEQERQASEQIDREGQARIAKLVREALKQPPKKEYSMPAKGDTRAVKEVKEAMQKARAKRSKSVDKPVDNSSTLTTPEVVHVEGSHSQPQGSPLTTILTTSEVVRTPKEHIDKELKVIDKQVTNKLNTSLNNLEVSDFDLLIDSGLKPEQVEDALATLLPLFAAEGLKPSSRVLADSIRQLHRDAK